MATKDFHTGGGSTDDQHLISLRSFTILLLAGLIGVAVGLSAGFAAKSAVAGIGAGSLAGLTAAAALNGLIERPKRSS